MHTQIRSDASPEICASVIFEMTGTRLDSCLAADLWPKMIQHKWLLSEKLGRDVGLRTAVIDFLENIDGGIQEYMDCEKKAILLRMGARGFNRERWESIPDTQPPKQLIQKRIVLPLKEDGLSRKHGVTPPKTLILFGPPGTGKTHFVKAVAGALSWWYIEILPSMLMEDGIEKTGTNLHKTMEEANVLDEAVIFIDEFDEIAGSRNGASRIDKSLTNEFLKQVQSFKSRESRLLLVCATNFVKLLDSALLRPGRFDCIIPVGGLDEEGRKIVLERNLARLNTGEVDLNLIVKMTVRFTPADIEYLFQQIAQYAFEHEYYSRQDYKVSTDDFIRLIPQIRPTLTDEIVEEFQKDSITFTRV